ncbi:hypothetical protein SADUNF_Sadunf09G0000100 [Salix dunnii]|uniref:Uncharacterized protein n=1 Tax=Salix dunnii TaxID=1413687 RepID=A0A835JWY9_9ROSI|nr:hypothetical protein SADUNF_Sadunf09G0000100 [Salix dunnii]
MFLVIVNHREFPFVVGYRIFLAIVISLLLKINKRAVWSVLIYQCMMELRPPDPVQLAPPVAMPSYAEMVNRGMDAKFQPNFSPRAYNKSFQSLLMGEKRLIVTDMRSSEKFQNAPAAIFYDDEVDALAAPLQRTLVGSALLNLAKSLGSPIQMDEATAKGTRPFKACVFIEFDCLEANFSSKMGNDSVVGDSQPIGLCGLNTNTLIPSNYDTIESTKSLNSDGRYLEFESHPRILTRRNSEGDMQSHSIKKDLGKKNLNVEFNETAIAKVTDAFLFNDGFND